MNKPRCPSLLCRVLNASFLTWVLLGFLASYLLFFVRPVFFSAEAMQFLRYVPAAEHRIGGDLKQNVGYSESWFTGQPAPYSGVISLYPPLTTILFAPLNLVKFSTAYGIVTLISVFCYVGMPWLYSPRADKTGRDCSLPLLIVITGLFSYGFQFELERGQFNVIAASCGFLAIWIYHCRPRHRYLAYALFVVSVQLKLCPLIFIVMLVHDWRDWKNNLLRFAALVAANVALLFVLGPRTMVDFVRVVRASAAEPYLWAGNHSIGAFVPKALQELSKHGWTWLNAYAGWLQLGFLMLFALCLGAILLQAYRQNQNGIHAYLFLACAIGALLIPSVSYDYKLPILAVPLVAVFAETSALFARTLQPSRRLLLIVLTLVLSTAYSSTLFSFVQKPRVLQNNFPALVAMLLAITCLSILSKPREPQETGS